MVPFERAMKTGVKSAALRILLRVVCCYKNKLKKGYVFANRFVQLGARCTHFMFTRKLHQF